MTMETIDQQTTDATQTANSAWRRLCQKSLREPLLHFMVAAAAMFVLYTAWFADDAMQSERDIVVTRADLLTFLQYRAKAFDGTRFAKLLDAMPASQREQLIADYVRQEAMYREAKALELDRNDYVAKLRLIQQLEFITQGFIDAASALSDDAIAAHYDQHRSDYREPATLTFTHVFFSYDRHGVETANTLAEQTLKTLNRQQVPFHQAMAHGDRPLYHVNYVRKEQDLIASHFSEAMAEALFDLKPDKTQWRGPYPSAYGAHLVLVTEHAAAYHPPFDEVRARVADDALRELRADRLDKAVDTIIDTYNVHLADDIAAQQAATPAPAGGNAS